MLRGETITKSSRMSPKRHSRSIAKAAPPKPVRPRKQQARAVSSATKAARVRRSQPIVLPDGVSVHDAFAVIAAACRDHWDANHAAAISGEVPEGIHQFRVGLRRFRTALTLFREHLPQPQYAWMKSEAKALGDLLSPARDLDVFLTELAPLAGRDARTAEMVRVAEQSRRDAQTRVGTTLVGARYRRFLTRLNLWLDGKAWRTEEKPVAAKAFARSELNRRLGKIQKRAKNIVKASPTELHDLRISIKKLRYGLEFFQTLLPERRAARIGRLLKSLQDSLGRLNDLEVAERTIGALASKAPNSEARAAVGRAGTRLAATFKPLAKAAQPEAVRIAARLRTQKPL